MNTTDTKSLIQNAPIPVASLDQSLAFIGYSKEWLKEFQLNGDPLTGRSFEETMPEVALHLKPWLLGALKGEESKSEGEKFTLSTGESEWVSWRIAPWYADDQSVGGAIVIAEIITQRKEKEELVLKAQRVARVGGWELDLRTNSIYWTNMTRKIHEVPEDYVPNLEEGINFYKAGKDRDTITMLVSEAMQNGTPWDTELQIITAKGREIWVKAKGRAEIINGECVRLLGTFQDIDAKKRAELRYKEVSDRLSVATKAAKIGIWDYDVVNNNLVWDDNMYELYGIRKEDFEGVVEAWEATVHPEDKAQSQKELEMALKGEQEFSTEFRVVWRDGTVRNIKAESVVHRDEKGLPLRMIGTNWDITALKDTEQKLRDLLALTTKQNDSLLNFAHIVSHNLRSHSTNLSMLTDLILNDKIAEGDKEGALKMLKESATSLSETILHLNEVVHLRTDPNATMETRNLYEAVEKVKTNINGLLVENQVVCQNKIPKDQQVMAIPAYLDSVLLNLFTNAIKYKHPERAPELILSCENTEESVILRFADNGMGIDLEKHGNKLFGMYKTFHKHKDAKGIGLFITKNQMEAMDGEVRVESEVNVGTTFSLFFRK